MTAFLEELGGIVCAIVGGELFLEGVIGLFDWLRIQKAVNAATLAAFTTTSPEISVAFTSVVDSQPEIALGDALMQTFCAASYQTQTSLDSSSAIWEKRRKSRIHRFSLDPERAAAEHTSPHFTGTGVQFSVWAAAGRGSQSLH